MSPPVNTTILQRSRIALLAVLLLATLVSICLAGPVGVYIALIAALGSLVFTFDGTYLKAALSDWGVRGFLLSFVLLWLAFAISAKDVDDVMAFVDFLALPVLVPAFALLARHANPSRITMVAGLAAGGAAVAVATGLYDVNVLGLARAQGHTSSIFFSGLAGLLGFFCLLGLLVTASKWRWLLLLGNTFGLYAVILGGARGAMLAYAVTVLLFAITTLRFWRQPMKLRLMTVGLVLLSAFVAIAASDTSRLLSIGSIISEAAKDGAITDTATNYRFAIYQGGLQAFLDSPIYGHGWWDRFAAAVPYMPEIGVEAMAHDSHAHLHNEILNFGSAAGVIGIAAYLILMAAPIVSAWRSPRTQNWAIRVGAACGLVGCYMTMGLVDVMFVFEVPKSMYVLCAAVIMAFFLDAPPVLRPRSKSAA